VRLAAGSASTYYLAPYIARFIRGRASHREMLRGLEVGIADTRSGKEGRPTRRIKENGAM